MALAAANLNLLPLLRELLKTRSVTLAADRLGVSQSAASQSLARLRTLMDDALLVRIGGRMQLTPRAKALAARVEALSIELNELFVPSRFDLGKVQRTFVIAADDYMALTAARPLFDLVRTEAPGIQLKFIEIGLDFTERMAAHEVDFALIPGFAARAFTSAPLRYRTFGTHAPGVFMDRGHPLAKRKVISQADLEPFAHVAFRSEGLERDAPRPDRGPIEVSQFWAVMHKVAVQTSHISIVPSLIRGTELVAIIPYNVGLELGVVWPTVTRKLSFGPAQIEHVIAWSPVFDADPAHAWFRSRVELQMMGRR